MIHVGIGSGFLTTARSHYWIRFGTPSNLRLTILQDSQSTSHLTLTDYYLL